jgi:exodeoxyribonuclease X
MHKLIFLDTESTGNDPKVDRLCQVCFEASGEIKVGYFKPPVPISVKAMSITHITNKMVESREAFADSDMKLELQKLLNDGVLVAHNALFDKAILESEGMNVPSYICTLRVARHLDQENKIPEYNLQYLRYFLNLEVDGHAHDAEGDVRVLKAVFERLFTKIRESQETDEEAIEEMIAISSHPSLFRIMSFGKHKGKSMQEVLETDRPYLEWLLAQKLSSGEQDEDWIYSLKHYLSLPAS